MGLYNHSNIASENTYEERKKELINHFISHTIWVFTNEIKKNYPYDLSQADISQYKEALRAQLNIPAYPISDEEFDGIINMINEKLKEFVIYLISNDKNKKNELSNTAFPDFGTNFHSNEIEEEKKFTSKW